MRILLAGATGAIGAPLVPMLVGAGHEVWGLSHDAARARSLEPLGARGLVADALSRDDVARAVEAARPDVVIQQLTRLPREMDARAMREGYATTVRLRCEGTANLMATAPGARIIAQSIAFAYRPEGDWVKDEEAPLWTDAPDPMGAAHRAFQAMERSVVAAGGVVLRYGFFYGPGTWFHQEGAARRLLARRLYPIIGKGTGHTSWIHVADAASATLAAVERGSGIYNVVDDHPAPQREWLPAMAEALGARPPRRVPAFLARWTAGPVAVHYGTALRGASNAKARHELGWAPRYADWRQGFAEGL